MAFARSSSSVSAWADRLRSCLEGFGGGERQGEDVGEAAVVGLHLADAFDVGAEAVPGVGVGEGVVDGLRVGVHLLGEGGGDQVVAGREATEQGGDADAGAAGDLVGGGFEPLFGEHLACGVDDPLAVAFGVGPQTSAARPTSALGPVRAS